MVTEFMSLLKVIIREILFALLKMDMVFSNSQMETFIKDFIRMVCHMEWANTFGKINLFIKAALLMDSGKEKENGKIMNKIFMKANTQRIEKMVKENTNGQTEIYT
jgi:hypothetical protein